MWPPYITDYFERTPVNAEENDYYGPWNSLLNFCFKIEEGYEIIPQKVASYKDQGDADSSNIIVSFAVQKNEAIILIVDIKSPQHISRLYARQVADADMRQRFIHLYERSASTLHGVSAFGRRISLYHLDKETRLITAPPGTVEPVPDVIFDNVPLNIWDSDVCQPHGYLKFMEIVDNAKAVALG